MMAAVGLTLGPEPEWSPSAACPGSRWIDQALPDGVGIVPIVMGLFGLRKSSSNLETEIRREILTGKIKNLCPTLKDWADRNGRSFERASSVSSSESFPAGEPSSLPLCPMGSKRSCPISRSNSVKAPLKESQDRRRPTTPQPGRLYPAPLPRHPTQRHHGDLFRPCDPRHAARAPAHETGPDVFWGIIEACTSGTGCSSFSTSRSSPCGSASESSLSSSYP